jgi:membrane protein
MRINRFLQIFKQITDHPFLKQLINGEFGRRIADYWFIFYRYLIYHSVWSKTVRWSMTHSLPGLQRIPLYNLIAFINKETKDDTLTTRANSMAFSFFLAIFPSIIVIFTLLAYTPLYARFDEVLKVWIDDVMPGSAGKLLLKTIKDITTIPRSGLLSFGFFLAIWFASNGMLSMMRGLEKDYKATFKQRTGFQKRLIAIQLTFLVALVMFLSVALVILGDWLQHLLVQYIKADFFTKLALFASRWVVVFALFYGIFSTIYRYGFSTRGPFWPPFYRSSLPGVFHFTSTISAVTTRYTAPSVP